MTGVRRNCIKGSQFQNYTGKIPEKPEPLQTDTNIYMSHAQELYVTLRG